MSKQTLKVFEPITIPLANDYCQCKRCPCCGKLVSSLIQPDAHFDMDFVLAA